MERSIRGDYDMAFATNEERLALIKSNIAFNQCPFVVRIIKNDRESEIACDDFDHAYNTASSWKNVHNAEYVEMFRVDEHDGSLYGGIGEW